MTKVLKICIGEWNNASRDKRELSVYRECGAEVIVMCKGNTDDWGREDVVDGFRVLRYSARPLKHIRIRWLNRVCALILWAKEARAIKPDIISGHDMEGLFIGWLSSIWGG